MGISSPVGTVVLQVGKTTVTSVAGLSVSRSEWNSATNTGWIFMKLCT
jgi:hypothetical protein